MNGALRWGCRRGMRELDQMLNAFLDERYPTLPEELRDRFAEWLEWPDPRLWDALMGPLPIDPLDLRLRELIRSTKGTLST